MPVGIISPNLKINRCMGFSGSDKGIVEAIIIPI